MTTSSYFVAASANASFAAAELFCFASCSAFANEFSALRNNTSGKSGLFGNCCLKLAIRASELCTIAGEVVGGRGALQDLFRLRGEQFFVEDLVVDLCRLCALASRSGARRPVRAGSRAGETWHPRRPVRPAVPT